jgi:hypothetical protein
MPETGGDMPEIDTGEPIFWGVTDLQHLFLLFRTLLHNAIAKLRRLSERMVNQRASLPSFI